jgi:N-acetylglucosamine kinase-like BadF-type ATPase
VNDAGSVAVIDGGKSCLRLVVHARQGRLSGEGPGFAYTSATDQVRAILDSVRQARENSGVTESVERLCVGLTGLPGLREDRARLAAGLDEIFPGCELLLTTDGVLAHVGALSGVGVVLSAGTGTTALALGAQGRSAYIDGWGPLIGDRGSGYAVGLAGLRAAAAAIDRVAPATSLVQAMTEVLAGTDLDALQRFYRAPDNVAVIAEFARHVARAAHAGDQIAIRIWHQAASDLASTARAAAHRIELTASETPVALTGRLAQVGDLLTDPLRCALESDSLSLVPAAGDAIAGGIRLLNQDAPAPYEALLERYPAKGAQC